MGNVTLSQELYLVCLSRVAVKCGTLVGLTGETVASLGSLVKANFNGHNAEGLRCAEVAEEGRFTTEHTKKAVNGFWTPG
jgi:hypothetical protein